MAPRRDEDSSSQWPRWSKSRRCWVDRNGRPVPPPQADGSSVVGSRHASSSARDTSRAQDPSELSHQLRKKLVVHQPLSGLFSLSRHVHYSGFENKLIPEASGMVTNGGNPEGFESMDWDINIGPIHIHIRFSFRPWNEARSEAIGSSQAIQGILECSDARMPAGFRKASRERLPQGCVFGVPWPTRRQMRNPMAGASLELDEPESRLFVVVRSGNDFHVLLIADRRYDNEQPTHSEVKPRGMIYTGQHAPEPLADEVPQRLPNGRVTSFPQPLRLTLDDRNARIPSTLRVDYTQIYVITEGVPVRRLGKAHQDHADILQHNFQYFRRAATQQTQEPRAATQHTTRRDSVVAGSSRERSQTEQSRNEDLARRLREMELRDPAKYREVVLALRNRAQQAQADTDDDENDDDDDDGDDDDENDDDDDDGDDD
ncbi:uncharacterized protein LTR77_002239 [Saxophila tyrrhenica]|uniref:DUF6590 domain-containing protein n=1 Tax=Saxophila tyrrhenica TaxID=1690608 RepID=A0AAV9PMN8_9PEZI|nr:hypothetical protein LTR77_002239 [Saxophila tyrrhenica]